MKSIMYKRIVAAILCVLLLVLCLGQTACGTQDGSGLAGIFSNDGQNSLDGLAASSAESSDPSEYADDAPYGTNRKLAATGQQFTVESTKLYLTDEMDTEKEKTGEYTLMIYLLGSNLESRFGSATSDLCELIDAGVDPEKVNILVYTGGSRRWLTGIPSDRNCVLELNGTNDLPVVAETSQNADMGAPETLLEFLDFCNTYYPADHNALILWDHGGGPLMGYGSDELFERDSLLLSEIDWAMKNSPFNQKHKLDWVGFDACLMGSLESMKLWSNYAKYYVGSEELEPGDGWNYDALSILNETQDPVEITSAIIDGFASYYEEYYGSDYVPDLTLAVSDLSKIGSVEKALNSLSGKMQKSAAGSGYSSLQQARVDTKAFGLTDFEENPDEEALDLVDLVDYTQRIQDFYPGKVKSLLDALDKLVVKSYTNVEHANGVSFYYPYKNKTMFQQWNRVSGTVSASDGFTNFLNTLSKKWLSGRSKDWSLNWEEDGYSVQLTEEQMKDTAALYYTVLQRGERYEYHPILEKIRVYPDENGLVTVPSDPQVICMQTGQDDVDPWPVVQTESLDQTESYATQKTTLFTDSDTLNYMDVSVCESEWEQCVVSLGWSGDSSEEGQEHTGPLQIRNISAKAEEDRSNVGKSTLDLSHYTCICYSYRETYPAVDGKNHTRPYTEWPDNGNQDILYCSITEQPEYVWKRCSELTEGAAIQLILEDTSGELYATPLTEITPSDPDKVLKEQFVETEKGEYCFGIYEDHAELKEYIGSDAELSIPETVTTENGENLPVTWIGCSAFKSMRTLKKVTLPESLKKIKSGAFRLSGIEEIQLPSGLEIIEENAFSLCFNLKSIDLPSGLTSVGQGVLSSARSLMSITMDGKSDGTAAGCVLKDGVLFTPDQKTLLAYPGGVADAYEVPDGTEEIGFGAFTRSSVTEVTLPEGLKKIGVSAFAGCKDLKMPELPASLETLEAHAFGAYTSDLHLTDEPQPQITIAIGPNLSYIGQGAFDRIPSRVFTVDEENTYFKAVEGNLCNGVGDAVTAFAMNGTGQLVVPDTVCTLETELFTFINAADTLCDDWSEDVDVEIPSSVTRFQGNWRTLLPGELLHVEAGSDAEAFAWKNSIDYNFCFDRTSEEYHVSEEAEQVHTIEKDGFIYDEDGTILLDAPDDIVEAVVPEGTLEIGERAFSYCTQMKSIVLPEGLRRIGDSAFYKCTALEEIAFPDSLEELGYGVFSDSEIPVKDGVLKLGENFRKLRPSSVWGLVFDSFEVDANNTSYSTVNGLLCNKQGTILYAVPTTLEGKVEIPEGIVVIPYDAVKTVAYPWHSGERKEDITDIVVPDSVKYIDRSGIPYVYDQGYLVTLWVKKGSYGQSFAKEYNVPVEIMS